MSGKHGGGSFLSDVGGCILIGGAIALVLGASIFLAAITLASYVGTLK